MISISDSFSRSLISLPESCPTRAWNFFCSMTLRSVWGGRCELCGMKVCGGSWVPGQCGTGQCGPTVWTWTVWTDSVREDCARLTLMIFLTLLLLKSKVSIPLTGRELGQLACLQLETGRSKVWGSGHMEAVREI